MIVAVLLAAAFCFAWVGRERLLPQVARWLDVGERPRACDYVLVLPGGEETRPFVAAAIFKAGLAQAALAPKVEATPDTANETRKPADEIIRAVLVRRGVSPRAIRLIGRGSTSTYTDALALKEFLRGRPPVTVAVVTHDFHTRRARWVFRKVLGDRSDDIYFVGAPNDRFDAENWWRCREGMWAHLSEYAKFVMYLFRYGGLAVWGGGALLAAAAIGALAWRWRRGPISRGYTLGRL